MRSCHMRHQYLKVLSLKVACQVEGIALCLGPSAVALPIPLNSAKCLKLSFTIVAGDQVVFQDGIRLPCRPHEAALLGYAQLMPIVIADPSCQMEFVKSHGVFSIPQQRVQNCAAAYPTAVLPGEP
jgi:hypothetical protein